MTIFYMVRHGNTEFNKKRRLQGGQVDSPLTKQGYKDAFLLAKKLKKIKFDAIFSSDLGRTFITAHIIADELRLTNKIFREKELREIDFGNLTAKFKEEISVEYKNIKSNSNYKAPNGESYMDVKNRIIKNLFYLANTKYKNLLIVTHAGCIRSVMSEAYNKDLNLLLERKISHNFIARFEIKNSKIKNFKIINE